MAASNAFSITSESFMIPSEPCPLPSLGSDEESFVVLWKDMDNKSLIDDPNEPVGTSVVEEAKQLINKELSQMQQSHITESSHQSQPSSLQKNSIQNAESDTKNTPSTSKLEQLTVLPKMPKVERGFESADIISITTLSTDLPPEEVEKKISQIIEENIRLKDTILQNNMIIESQYERIRIWQEDVQVVHEFHKEKILKAKEIIDRLKKENHNLTCDIEQLREIKNMQEKELNSLKETLREREQQTNEKLVKSAETNMKEFELDIANKKIKELELAVQNMTLENDNLKDDKTTLMKDVTKIDEYEKEIEKLHELLHASKMQVEETKMELLKVKSVEEEKQKSLNEIIEKLRSQLVMTQQQAIPLEEMSNFRQQLTSTQIVLTQVEHSRAAAYARMEAMNKEMLVLREQLQEAQSQKNQQDEIYALQTQLDLYKADFETERSAKEAIKLENEKYSEDMQNLQRRNQQLQEEIEMIREHRDYDVYPSHRRETTSTSRASSNDSPPLRRFVCPICNLQFRSLRLVEDHIETCICQRD